MRTDKSSRLREINEELNQVATTARRLNHEWIRDTANMYLHELDRVRGLPRFYYTDVAHHFRISPALCRKEFLTYPITKLPTNPFSCCDLITILNTVYRRSVKWPRGMSFRDGKEELFKMMEGLEQEGYTIQNMADHLRLPYHTIYQDYRRINMAQFCPWDLMAQLETIHRLPPGRRETPDEKARRRQASLADLPQEGEQEIPRYTKQLVIMPGSRCRKCSAPWNNLYRDGEDPVTEVPLFTCRSCGVQHLLDTGEGNRTQDVNKHELIRRGGDCWNCGAGWERIRVDHQEGTGDPRYYCSDCYVDIRLKTRYKEKAGD